ncbi:type II toxin-antitoxin system RelE/ParE family toxin [Chryseobacterium sp. 3008163]|uniref:type II toxin-antitoxin system RelE/ParE family toxin n=1 Tax=Chryseobacterium sp. 3008163 TaxID=2478663 RepID=UPI000F0CDC0B|nr:type II toxin-antitoxin system RelE/ParE family toxin [Chryseobacterium sp. 3008163]AYN02116.1 type II toxin-antitoxin system RelE/ParE family toxin [Chryseobacterium sp. 3008163]
MVQIKWLKSAKSDLKEIYDFISLDSKRYARFQIEKIQHKTEILRNGNVIGKKVSEIDDENMREILKEIIELFTVLFQKMKFISF